MLAIEDSPAGRFLDSLGDAIPRPRHRRGLGPLPRRSPRWHAGRSSRPHTVHDFGGFPEPLYALRYRRPGIRPWPGTSPADRGRGPAGQGSAKAMASTMACGSRSDACTRRPGIPVVPLSVRPDADAASHYRLGQALAGLADEGVLVIGSGGFVHNLGALAWGQPDAPMPGWARASSATGCASGSWPGTWKPCSTGNARRRMPACAPDHRTPAAAVRGHGRGGGRAGVRHLHDSHEYGSLALDAFAFG